MIREDAGWALGRRKQALKAKVQGDWESGDVRLTLVVKYCRGRHQGQVCPRQGTGWARRQPL